MPSPFLPLSFLLILAACSPVPGPGMPPRQKWEKVEKSAPVSASGQVIGITDGDTLRVLLDGSPVRIRLSGIDAPEKNQPFGTAARKALSDAVFGKTVSLETHGADRYGRLLADVYIGPQWMNLHMVRKGLAWRYVAYSQDPRLIQAEAEARAERIGLWGERSPVPPWAWRRK